MICVGRHHLNCNIIGDFHFLLFYYYHMLCLCKLYLANIEASVRSLLERLPLHVVLVSQLYPNTAEVTALKTANLIFRS